MLRYVASLPFDEQRFASPAVLCVSPAHCPSLLALLEDFVSSHQLGAFLLLFAFGVGAGFSLGCIVRLLLGSRSLLHDWLLPGLARRSAA